MADFTLFVIGDGAGAEEGLLPAVRNHENHGPTATELRFRRPTRLRWGDRVVGARVPSDGQRRNLLAPRARLNRDLIVLAPARWK